jgi:anti-sigma factor RsiW
VRKEVDMRCDEFRDALEQYLDDALEESRRASFRRHLRDCPECRSWAVGVEPTMVFAAVQASAPDPDRVAACTASVMAQIRQQRLALQLRPRRGRWLAAAAAVVAAIVGGAGWWITHDGQPPVPAAAVEARDPSGDEAQPPRVLVNMPDEGVRVYQFADDGDHDTAVYYIVNPALES